MRVLENIKILEITRVAPAELPGMMLADIDADLLKIESPEPSRNRDFRKERLSAFVFVNRNKHSMTLNMKTPEGCAIFQGLTAGADVIIEGFRPGVMKRLGADYVKLSALNPRLTYCSLSGFGLDGPYRDYSANDINYLSLAGVLGLIGDAGRKPVIPPNLVADYAGASLHGALGIILALYEREQTGYGRQVDISYLDTTVSLLAATPNMRFFFSEGVVPQRGAGFLGGSYPYYATYETRDKKLLTIGCTETKPWENFCKVLGRSDLTRFAQKPDHFVRAADAEDVAGLEQIECHYPDAESRRVARYACQGRCLCRQSLRCRRDGVGPQNNHRKMIIEAEQPGARQGEAIRDAIKLSETPGSVRHAAPVTGEHTAEVLRDLGMGSEIEKLRVKGVIE